ncbi:toll/interleukin-1 receptor domain-containing protein [Streptomyces litchfieldiae]|uniref:Toll/interleukin-1 receptor domain-containing protein n=1 Tax=Streptomyces litchfieldiae TaxID=3075543 RepID=A0ABU2MS08_9ACTN|nr:toll/interleukin-1 receptor domain-containing protein [Streptomyces sp. DSM 44938]MDT0344418.1 toll/interleukin-1 receptor domain-containing protein [Streptomyces sp. DSM 44938]
MPEVFINYRTSDGKEAAYAICEELSRRFGDSNVFLAAKSIAPGENYVNALHRGVRRSSVLLALIGEGWLDAPHRTRPEARALDDEQDWVRREIEDAFEHGVAVIPILIGRKAEQLDPQRLPGSLARLAECQYMRYTLRSARHDLALIGDRLAKQVPELAAADTGPEPTPAETGKATTSADEKPSEEHGGMHNTHQRGGIGNISGTVGTVIGESNAPLHTGSGDQIHGTQVNGTHVNGDGTSVGGSIHGGIQHHFGPSRRRRENER